MLAEIQGLLRSDGIQDVQDFAEKKYLRFSYAPKGNRTALFYLDYSDEVPVDKASLDRRQTEILAKDYFENQSALQWNMYLYFLVDDEKLSRISLADLTTVENDVNYAKKRVTSPSGMKELIPFTKIFSVNGLRGESGSEVVSKWIDLLSKEGLNEVFDESNPGIDEVLKRYELNQQPTERRPDVKAEYTLGVSAPDFIEFLDIKKFRRVKSGTYNFAQFNLFEGPNGTGKTSCLEAIELAMCGKIKRLTAANEPLDLAEISLKYRNSDEVDFFEANRPGKYREREKSWYKVATKGTQSNLCKTFSLHNFYNTDAAFTFANDKELEEVWRSLEAMSIGEKASTLFRRIEGFDVRAKKRKSELGDSLLNAKAQLEDLKIKVSNVKTVPASNPIDNKVFLSKVNLAFDGKAYISITTDQLTELRSIAVDYRNRLSTLERHQLYLRKNLGLSENLGFCNELESAMRVFVDLQRKIAALDLSISGDGKKISLFQEKLGHLVEFERYVHGAPGILVLNQTIKALQLEAQNLESALQGVDSVDLISAGVEEVPVSAAIQNVNVELKKKNDDLREIESKILEITNKNRTIESLVSELKALGRRYLDLRQDAHSCPLCDSTFELVELQKRIESFSPSLSAGVELSRSRKETEEKISELRALLESLTRLSTVGARLSISMSNSAAFVQSEIIKARTLALDKRSMYESAKMELDRLARNGFSVEERLSLENSLRSYGMFRDSVFDKLDQSAVSSEIAARQLELDTLRLLSLKNIAEKERLTSELMQLPLPDERETLHELQKNASGALRELEAFLVELKTLLNLEPGLNSNVSIFELQSALTTLMEEIARFDTERSSEQSNVAAISSLKDSLVKAENEEKDISNRFQRMNAAHECLNNIVSNFNTKEAVESFYLKNKATIVEIFKAIHTPKEFVDISIESKEIWLSSVGGQRSVNQMSTGQRSALVLSFFFGMHLSSFGAPKIIMFDDPVSFVDDLNTLTFLDFLREFCINLNRQIFFSTANRKLAALVRRKFESLGDGFKAYDTGNYPILDKDARDQR